MPVFDGPVGKFPAIPALDDTWRLSHDDPPPIGEVVEVCWAHCKTPESEPAYHQSTGSVKKYSTDRAAHGHTWLNSRGQEVLFNPSFWRPVARTESQ